MITNRLEEVILKNLFFNEEYLKRVYPFLNKDLFFEKSDRVIFDKISEYVDKFHSNPSCDAVLIACDNDTSIPQSVYSQVVDTLAAIVERKKDKEDLKWIISETEKFCKDKSLSKAILDAYEISQNSSDSKGKIPDILQKALAVSFDTHIGHSYIDDVEKRFDEYTKQENRISCDLDILNKIMGGGVTDGTLNMIMAGCVHPDTKIKVRIRKRNV